MDSKTQVQVYLQNLKQQLATEEKLRQDFEKRFNEEQKHSLGLREQLQECETKLALSRNEIDRLETKVDLLTSELSLHQDAKSVKVGFLGKMFSGSQIEQLSLKNSKLERDLTIQQEENETLHAQIFTLKTQMDQVQNHNETTITNYEAKLQKLLTAFKTEKQKTASQLQIINSQVETIQQLKLTEDHHIAQLSIKSEEIKECQMKEHNLNEQITELNISLRKLTNSIIEKENINQCLREEQAKITYMHQSICELLSQQVQSELSANIIKILNFDTPKETILISNINAYQTYTLAKERLLTISKKNDELLKKNQQYEDKRKIQKN